MNIAIYPDSEQANKAAAERLSSWLTDPATRTVMPAAGNTPLDLYRRVAEKKLPLSRLTIFVLDEYVGVPLSEPRNCTNLLRKSVRDGWGIPDEQFFWISSVEKDAMASVQQHERRIEKAGGLDVLILGLGQNGHLGFNEPGSAENSKARILSLEPISVEANRQWFQGKYAPDKGVTVGLSTILAARKILIMAYGPHKTVAVRAMVKGPRDARCPASLLQGFPDVHVFLDSAAAADLDSNEPART